MAAPVKKRKPKKAAPRYIWTEGRFAVEDQLPLPVVDYWKSYAAFLGFAETVEGPFSLCECARPALANAIEMERRYLRWREDAGQPDSLSEQRLPLWATHVALADLPEGAEEATERFRFGERLCHRCNMATPSMSFCDPMYGSRFKQTYGWYIAQNHYRLGVRPTSLDWLPEVVPPELAELLSPFPTSGDISFQESSSPAARSVARFAENATRQEFGVAPVGEGWVSESLLAKIVAELLPDEEIVRHIRPDWLEGLELDIWLPGHKTGIEYQGQQHFHAIKAWGGQKALDGVRERDTRKARLCAELGIRLVTVDYTEPLTHEHVRSVLAAAEVTRPSPL